LECIDSLLQKHGIGVDELRCIVHYTLGGIDVSDEELDRISANYGSYNAVSAMQNSDLTLPTAHFSEWAFFRPTLFVKLTKFLRITPEHPPFS